MEMLTASYVPSPHFTPKHKAGANPALVRWMTQAAKIRPFAGKNLALIPWVVWGCAPV